MGKWGRVGLVGRSRGTQDCCLCQQEQLHLYPEIKEKAQRCIKQELAGLHSHACHRLQVQRFLGSVKEIRKSEREVRNGDLGVSG